MLKDAIDLSTLHRVLVVKLRHLGDVLLTSPVFTVLKNHAPHLEIDALVYRDTEPMLSGHPAIANVFTIDRGWKQEEPPARMANEWRLFRSLRARGYDRAIVLPNSLKSAIVPYAGRARVRTGFLGELRYGLLNDIRRLDKQKLPRTVDRFVALGIEPGAALPEIPPPRIRADMDKARMALARLGRSLPAAPVLGLCPGAEYGPAKRWPAEYFADVAQAKLAEGWEVWLFGSDNDAPVTGAIQSMTGKRCFDLGGKTTLEEAIDLLSLTAAVTTNDSGLMHVAAALDRQVIALYGSSDPRHTPPLSDKASVLYLGLSCSPCFKRECPLKHLKCLRDLPPERVLAALKGSSD